ncbi:pentatricopeptide repeat-containing protein [Carex littledalei]|uniref:Pentatricopeptide repeat-containing protein n=1 Tax=Carex littledalei TaxID=544730 RepID=A0A833R5J8_9POAL|nr:pentatricopeptide repeat-containing protein [Carex littledalei]
MPPLLHSICSFPSTVKSVFETSRTKPKASFLSHLTKNPTLSLKKQVCATSATFQDEISPEITTINLPDRKNYSKKRKRILEAYQLFEKMTDQGHKPTPSTCNTLVFALCDHGMFRKAVQIVEFMLRSGMLLDEVCTLIVKNLTTIGAYEYAIQLLDEMEQRGCTLDPEVYDKLIKSLCRKADTLNPSRGWHCLDKLVQKGLASTNPDTINRLINTAYLQGGTYLTVSVLTQILLRGGEPDFRCYHKVLAAYKEDDLASEALELFSVLPPSLKYDLGIYNVLLNTLGYQGRWSEAEALLDDMMERGFMPDIVTYKGLILAIANKGYTQEALEIVEELRINEFEIDTWCFNPIIMRFCSEGQLNMVHKCLKNMERWNCPFNNGTCRAIALLCNRGMLDEAVKILESLRQKKGNELHSFYGKELFGYLCCRGNTFEALQILTKLEQVQYTPKLQTFLYFVNGLCMECFHEEAVEMFEVMDKYNVRPNIDNYNKLVLELCKGGRIDLAIMALEKMVKKGYEPTESTYVIIIEAIGNLERKDLVGELLRELYARGEVSQESVEKISLKFCLDNVGF